MTLVDDADLVVVIPDRDRPQCVLQLRLSAAEITGGWAFNDIPWDYVDTTGPHALRLDRLALPTRERSSRPQPGWSSSCAARWSCASGAGTSLNPAPIALAGRPVQLVTNDPGGGINADIGLIDLSTMAGDGMAIVLLGRVVRDAWHQCRRRPLAVLLGLLLAGGSPGFPPHLIQGSQEVHGWANLVWLGLPAVIVLGYLAPLLMVAYLGTANPSQPNPAGGAIHAAVQMTRRALRPGIAAAILMWVFVTIPGTIAIWVGEAVLGLSFMADPPDLSGVAQRQELLFRLTVVWPLTAIGLAVLALLLPRIVLDGARSTERAANLSGRIARRAPLVCLLIGLLDAAGAVIRAGTSFSTASAVAAVVGLGAVFATAMANALLWHTRPWQPIDDQAERTRSRW